MSQMFCFDHIYLLNNSSALQESEHGVQTSLSATLGNKTVLVAIS
jgi:hypothetical protein